MKLKAMAIFALLLGASCKSQDLPTVNKLDLERYQGKWYEIARLPNRFEKGLNCITATYTVREDGKVTVENR
ncbi:MAG: apolipoprotein and lipocalin family protein [Tenuifilum sp.]|jgi:apolipoprotein D and lipocalin family protein|nr:apolipoprotein and lipocalin family protein [Tenuifilum sp.]